MDSNCNNICGSITPLKVEYTWEINNFNYSKLLQYNEGIVSPTFFIGSSGDLQGRLIIRQIRHITGYVSLFFNLNYETNEFIKTRLQFCLLNKNRKKFSHIQDYHTFVSKDEFYILWNFFYWSVIQDEANGLLIDDTITILCRINILSRTNDKEGTDLKLTKKLADKPMDCPNQLAINEFSDVTLICHGVEFRAHQKILADYSIVFSSIFMEMDDKKTNVEIEDVKPEILREVLRFIYTAKIENRELLPKLVKAADKYEITELKDHCERLLLDDITVLNVFENLILGDRYNLKKLKNLALKTIVKAPNLAVKTKGFQLLQDSQKIELMAEAFYAVAQSQSV